MLTITLPGGSSGNRVKKEPVQSKESSSSETESSKIKDLNIDEKKQE